MVYMTTNNFWTNPYWYLGFIQFDQKMAHQKSIMGYLDALCRGPSPSLKGGGQAGAKKSHSSMMKKGGMPWLHWLVITDILNGIPQVARPKCMGTLYSL